MSYLLTNGSLLCRLGSAGIARQTAALISAGTDRIRRVGPKVLDDFFVRIFLLCMITTLESFCNFSVPAASPLCPGQVYTAKYYQTLAQKQKDQKQMLSLAPLVGTSTPSSPSTLQSSSLVAQSKRLMSASGHHVTLWTAERLLSAALVPIIPAALLMPCAPLDYLMAFGLTIHSHWYD
jgi:hypothetical protein